MQSYLHSVRCLPWLLAILLALPFCCGCEEAGPEVYPVSGKITYQGQPAAGVVVILHPEGNISAPEIYRQYGYPGATVAADGTFRVNLLAEADGAPPGEYSVLLTWPFVAPATEDEAEPQLVDPDRLRGSCNNPAQPVAKITVDKKPAEIPPIDLK